MPVVDCPKCHQKVEFTGNPFRPFCSERCKLLDLGDWAMEKYRVPVEGETPSESDAIPKGEKDLKKH